MTIASGQTASAADVNNAIAAMTNRPNSGKFYADAGASVNRLADRLLVGAAADNQAHANRDLLPRDWLSNLMASTAIGAWATWGAQTASIATCGSMGVLGASRTSDATASKGAMGYVPSSIGIGAWVIDDDTTTPRTSTGYAFYGEAWRMAGVAYQPVFAMELEAVNLGGAAVGVSTPYNVNIGGGAYGIQLGVGGGQPTGTSNAETAITLVQNPTAWNHGLVFGASSLAGTDGSSGGYGSAIEMAAFHGVSWHTPEVVQGVAGNNAGAFIRSIVTVAAQGGRMEFQNGQVVFLNNAGQALFSISTSGTATNILNIQPGGNQQAAGIYVQEGNGGSPNLGLFPAAGGELQITSPVVAQGATIAANEAPAGWLKINVNGTDYRVALFTASQAGG